VTGGTQRALDTALRVVLAAVLAAILALAATGCLPTLTAESTAPPGRTARLDAVNGFWGVKGYRLEVSQGVVLAISCDYFGPCEKLAASSDDAAVAEVRPAALTALRPAFQANQQTAARWSSSARRPAPRRSACAPRTAAAISGSPSCRRRRSPRDSHRDHGVVPYGLAGSIGRLGRLPPAASIAGSAAAGSVSCTVRPGPTSRTWIAAA